MKKLYKIIIYISILVLVLIGVSFGYIHLNSKEIIISKIELINYDEENDLINISVKTKGKSLHKYNCYANNSDKEYKSEIINNKCDFMLNKNDYNIYLADDLGHKSEIYLLSEKINNVLSFNFIGDTIYLALDESTKIDYKVILIGNEELKFKSSNEDIVKVENNIIDGISSGEAYIYLDGSEYKQKVIVTDLITKPYATKDKKEILPCNAFTADEAKLLDNILETKINNAGYQTRAGAVAAARFLTLEFKYRVPYYFETGRIKYENKSCTMTNINKYIVDGEGRYYHKGLYLSDDKKEDITASKEGPAIWGCKIRNLERKPEYGYIPGVLMPNGLDCSGFVTWSLKNAGFEPGDIGAGESPEHTCQCTDLGEFVPLTSSLLKSDKLRAGDLINWWGHIGMIIGIDKENDTYYVAESLSYIGGVRAMIYSSKELLNTFTYVVLMDSYYKEDGNYSAMWN